MQGMFTGLLGNLSLLSYFTKKRENEVIIVQTLGVLSQFVVFVQLALAEAMPMPYFVATSVVVGAGLVLNFVNYFNCLNAAIWRLWEDFITVGGLSVLPQVIAPLSLSACPNTQDRLFSSIYFFIQIMMAFLNFRFNLDERKYLLVYSLILLNIFEYRLCGPLLSLIYQIVSFQGQ